eukprot:8161314-Heterocapsa_arctica.AAC.1
MRRWVELQGKSVPYYRQGFWPDRVYGKWVESSLSQERRNLINVAWQTLKTVVTIEKLHSTSGGYIHHGADSVRSKTDHAAVVQLLFREAMLPPT